jgi:chemotaxis protein methyltransferase CheR
LNDSEYTYLKVKILSLTGIDLNNYKSLQMRRRLDGLISRSHATEVAVYCKLIERDAGEVQKLKNFFTINVSEFFRDQAQFENLENRVLPMLLERSKNLNIWSAGCSMGAEPYSIAMLLERIAPKGLHRILATDLDQTILDKAKTGGPYVRSDVRNVPEIVLKTGFTQSPEGYMVNRSILPKVEFRQQDMLRDSFEKDFDLIVCRNVVIYFSDEAKAELNQKFYDSLKPQGVMFIGGTETLMGAQELGFKRMTTSFYQKGGTSESKTVRRPQTLPARAA